ncbi:hypothetical protein I4U23_029570 [Adineta vaga]|nr:hypothetical protein I4U23_029570 [Adineta vaga]
MYENTTLTKPSVYHYETIPSSPVQSLSNNNTQQASVYISLECNSLDQLKTNLKSLTPSFQRKLPIASVAILGLFEFLSGLIVLTLELLIFDIALGLWCGVIYALAGASILVLVIGTDRERHQTSAVLIFQLVALMFTITELFLHSESYRKRCLTKVNEPTREMTFYCQILLIQISAAVIVLISTIVFSIIYFRVTMIVLKQPHGTCNMSNALNLNTC